MFYKYPFSRQETIKDCATASLQMIIKYYNGYTSIERLRNLMKTDKNGTNAYNLIEAAKTLGFEAYGIKTKLEQLNKDNLILPAIAHVVINNSYTHFVVIYDIDYKKKKIIIGDPASKIYKTSFEEFDKIFSGVLIILYPKEQLEIEKKSNIFELIFKILKSNKKDYINVVLLSFLILLFTVVLSSYFQILIDNIYHKTTLIQIFILFIALTLIKSLTTLFRNEIMLILKQKIDFSLTLGVVKQIINLPYQYYKTRSTGDVISRIGDLENIKQVLNNTILIFFIEIPFALLALLILLVYNKPLFLISFINIILYILLSRIFRKKFNSLINDCQNKKANVTTCMVESVQGFETVKGLNINENVINNLELKYSKYLEKTYELESNYNIQEFFKENINEIGFLTTIFVGIFLIKNNVLTLGMLITLNTLISYFLEPIKNIVNYDYSFKEANSSYKRISELFHENKNIELSTSKGNVKVSNLSFTYNNRIDNLKNINLEIKEGNKVLLIGKSGSGKSTLLKLIKKYYESNSGISIANNREYSDSNIAYIAQNEILFTDSLVNNLKLNRNIDLDDINSVITLCNIDSIIKNNNLGLNMLIEENGFNLSGGEKQRIILARTILNNFDILLIDEGLNQVDINLERKILKKLFNKYYNKTIVIVSHRYNNMDLFDRVIEMSNGTIRKDIIKC